MMISSQNSQKKEASSLKKNVAKILQPTFKVQLSSKATVTASTPAAFKFLIEPEDDHPSTGCVLED